MEILANLRIRNKLLLLLCPPILLLLFFVGRAVMERVETKRQMDGIERDLNEVIEIDELVRHLQRERGLSVGYLGSAGAKFKSELKERRQEVDTQLRSEQKHSAKTWLSTHPEAYRSLKKTLKISTKLSAIRKNIDQLKITIPQSMAFYTEVISSLLQTNVHLRSGVAKGTIARWLAAHSALSQLREAAGQERALLSRAFNDNEITAKIRERRRILIARQEAYQRVFLELTDNHYKRLFAAPLPGGNSLLGISNLIKDPVLGWKMVSSRIKLIGQTEKSLEKEILSLIRKLHDDAHSELLTFCLVVFGALVLIGGLYYRVTLGIIHPLESAVSVARGILAGKRDIPINVTGADEPAQLLLSLREMLKAIRAGENALREREERLSVTLQSIGDAVIATDAEGRITRMNAVAENLTGWSIAEARGARLEKVFNIINEYTREPVENPAGKVLRTGVIVALANHTILIAKDGSECPIADSGAPIQVEEGSKALGVIIVFRNQTKERAAQKKLAASEKQYRRLFQQANDAIIIHDFDGLICDVNPRTCEMLGYTREDLLTMQLRDLREEGAQNDDADLKKIVLVGEARFESQMVRADGSPLEVDISTRVVDMKLRLIQSFVRDISKTKKDEQNLRMLSTAINQASETVIVTDALGNIQYANPAFEKITGYLLTDVIGKNMRILKSGKHNKAFYDDLWRTITTGNVWNGHFINKRQNGEIYHTETSIAPVRDSLGTIVRFVATKHDVTEAMILEEQYRQAQKMEVVGRLAGGIAHDFNNLLTGAMGYAELLEALLHDKPKESRYVQQILAASKRAAELTHQLLTFARKSPLERMPIDLATVISDTVSLLHSSLDKRVTIEYELPAEPVVVLGDIAQLESILLNLGVNAGDAMPDGGTLTITVQVKTLDKEEGAVFPEKIQPGVYALLSVSDTGMGMDEKTCRRVFEPFYTTKGPGKGTGLGLASAYGSVISHEGAIRVESELGRGTLFTICLPLHEHNKLPVTLKAPPVPTRGEGTILVIDDEPVARELAQDMLSGLGYTVHVCRDGKEGIEDYRKNFGEIDLILLDMNMPGMSGNETFTALREINKQAKILICTGYALDKSVQTILNGGAVGRVTKPYSYQAISRKIAQILAKNRR